MSKAWDLYKLINNTARAKYEKCPGCTVTFDYIDDLFEAVREETIAKEWALVTEIEARGFTCGSRENALRVAKELGIQIEES